MPPALQSTAASPQRSATIGPPPDKLIRAWSEAADLGLPLELFTVALGIRTATQRALFAGTLGALEGLAPILRRWDLNGSRTYGLARLADAWTRRPWHLALLEQRVQYRGTPSADFFNADLKEKQLNGVDDALFFLLEEALPFGEDETAQRCLRAWLLLHAMRIATDKGARDQLVARVARFLASAALETETRKWRDWLAQLGKPADTWEEVNDRFNPYSTSYLRPSGDQPTSAVTSAAERLARGDSDPLGTSQDGAPSLSDTQPAGSVTLSGQASIESLEPDEQAEIFDLPAERSTVAAAPDGPDLDDEITCVRVDPDSTSVEHSLYLQSLQLRLGAAARFLPWGTWDSLTPPELAALQLRIASTLAHPADASQRLLAAVVQIAVDTGQTLEKVAQMPLAAGVAAQAVWHLDLAEGVLRRRPPRHESHWQPRNHLHILSEPAESLIWPADRQALSVLKSAAAQRPGASFLGQLRPRSALSLRREFRAWVKADPATSRIEGSFLASALGQRVYDKSGDAVLARLFGTSERQTLPASTAYTAFLADAVERALPQLDAGPTHLRGQLNVAGSRLDPIDNDLIQSDFADAFDGITASRRRGDWIDFHNRVALHWDAALRAATGARPVDDLWKSPLEFDWDHAQVYVDDKASPFGETGRLIPLPRELCERFKADYVDRHIPWVLDRLTSAGSTPSELPSVLFVIECKAGGFTLEGVQNHHRSSSGRRRYEGSLPVNVFRHRLRTRLHRCAGLDLEIVDTVMGHRDGATLTHGRYTMRVWREDAEAIRAAMATIFGELGFEAPALWAADLPASTTPQAHWPLPAPVEPRHTARTSQIATASSNALAAMHQYVKNEGASGRLDGVQSAGLAASDPNLRGALISDIGRLSEEQIDELSQLLLRGDHAMPSLLGVARYEVLIELAQEAWTQLGKRVRIRKRYAGRQEEASPFTPLAARAPSVVGALKTELEAQFKAVPSTKSTLKLVQALGLAVYDLVLVGRIALRQLLDDVIKDDTRWRIVSVRDEFHLEWNPSEDLRARPDAPVLRFAVTARSAWLLGHAIRGKTRHADTRRDFASWAACFSRTVRSTLSVPHDGVDDDPLETVIRWLDQCNAVELPGTVAAYLGGRLKSPSLPWGDWMKLVIGQWMVTSRASDTAKGDSDDEPTRPQRQLQELPNDSEDDIELCAWTLYRPTAAALSNSPTGMPRGSRGDEAYRLFAELRSQLNSLRASTHGARHRELVAERMALEVEKSTKVASAIQLLGLWAIDLLLRPGRSRKLAISSVLRYFGALSPRFQAMGYDVELHAMDDDEIESFYAEVITGGDVENPRDLYDGLRNFHLFARTAAGLPPVDWSALGVPDTLNLGSPGWIDDETYLQLIERLGSDDSVKGTRALQLQCIAIVARRFGLRGAEATGLRRSDVQWGTGIEAVIVRNNRGRELKTPASRRVVPLAYELASIERQALARLIDAHSVDTNGSPDAPLFYLDTEPDQPIDGIRARARINEHMKALTGQPASTMHKLRKAFVIDLWTAIESPSTTPGALSTSSTVVRTKIVETLLGHSAGGAATRRGMWAVARAAGHGGPATTLRSYAHLLSDVAASYVRAHIQRDTWSLKTDAVPAIRLDRDLTEFTRQAEPTPHPEIQQVTPLAALKGLLHLAHGRSPSAVAEAVGLPFETVDSLSTAADTLYAKLRPTKKHRPARTAKQRTSRRLAAQGVLNLVHVNAHARLRAGLSDLPPSALTGLRRLPAVVPNEWAAIVGVRRKFSMWRPEHFHLTAIACRHLVTPTRLAIEMPPLGNDRAADRIRAMAYAAGWAPDSSRIAAAPEATLCQSIEISSRQPPVKLPDEGLTVDARAAMRLTNVSASDHVCDGFELAVALICLNACAGTEQATLAAS